MRNKKLNLEDSTRLYFSIKDVAEHFGVEVSTLRFWEKEFKEINPRKTAGGTRQYSRNDISTIGMIYHLLKEQGLTIEGAKQRLKNKKGGISNQSGYFRAFAKRSSRTKTDVG